MEYKYLGHETAGTVRSLPGVMVNARIAPGKLEAKAIMPGPPCAV